MLLPGFRVCGSAIHAAREPRVVSKRPAAIYFRPPTCVRSGPVLPFAAVPRIAWQAAHGLDRKTRCPAITSASEDATALSRSHVVSARRSQLPGRKETRDGESADDNHSGCDRSSHSERHPSLPAWIESDG